MKRTVVITVIVSLTLNLFCQNWNLFPENQLNYYEIVLNDKSSVVEVLINDSVSKLNDSTFFYFDTKKPEGLCKTSFELKKDRWRPTYLRIDSIFSHKDTIYHINISPQWERYFIFAPKSKPGDSWSIPYANSSFKCDSVSEKIIFGQPDSVKYFTPLGGGLEIQNLPFVLSKNFGLIEFVPFYYMVYFDLPIMPKVTLIGFEKEDKKYGIKVPEFKDFFHLSTSDVLFWEYDADNQNNIDSDENYFYKDSIVKAVHTVDSVFYEIKRNRTGNNETITQCFKKEDYEKFISTYSSSGVLSGNVPFPNYRINESTLLFWNGYNFSFTDSISSLSFICLYTVLDTLNCDLTYGRNNDYSKGFSMNTKFGLTEYCGIGDDISCNTLVGAIVNGENWGNIDVPLKIIEKESSSLSLYPNPVTDKLTIQTNELINKIEIIDVSGKVVMTTTKKEINVSNLLSGLYAVRVTTKSSIIVSRMVKR